MRYPVCCLFRKWLFEYMGRRRLVLAFVREGLSLPRGPEVLGDGLADFTAQVRQRPLLPPPDIFSDMRTVEGFAEIID